MLYINNTVTGSAMGEVNKRDKKDQAKVFLFMNARDEPNLAEWIAHHFLLGFSRIFIFDHLSIVPIDIQLADKFHTEKLSKSLKIIRSDGTGNVKRKFMQLAIQIAQRKAADWMLYLDADEFLYLRDFSNVKEMLSAFNYADSLGINWVMFGTSGYTTQPTQFPVLTKNFIHSDAMLNKHVKAFVRPSKIISIHDPHSYYLKHPERYYALTGNRMPIGPFNEVNIHFENAPGFIAHYYIQSESEFQRRKGRLMDDGTGLKNTIRQNIHTIHNEKRNTLLRDKYSHKIEYYFYLS